MKKFIIIAPVYPLNQPENEDYIGIPAEIARGMGFEAEIISLRKEGEAGEETINGFKVKRFGNAFSLLAYIIKEKPCLIHSTLRPYLPSLLTGLLPYRKVHWPMSDILGSNSIIKALSVILYKRYDKILAHTPYGEQLFLANGFQKEKVEVLPLPVNFELFSKPKSAKGLRMLKLKRKPFIITCVANFRSIKGVDVLIEAFSLFMKKAKNARLVLVGKDFLAEEGKPSIKQMAEEFGVGKEVMHLGFLQGIGIKAILDVSDVFCMASRVDAQCLSIYEASAGSIPLCLSELPAFTSVFKSAALYHKVGDAGGLAEDLAAYYKEPKLRKTNGAEARKFAAAADYKIVRRKLEELYRSLLLKG